MTARDALVEKAARALAALEPGEDWPTNAALGGGLTGTRDDEFRDEMLDTARDMLDALLPQVSTVAELEALRDGTRLVRNVDGSIIERFDGVKHGLRSRSYSAISAEVALMRGPLTVVWQPTEDAS